MSCQQGNLFPEEQRVSRMEERVSLGKQEKVYRIFEEIADGYDSANVRISLGMQQLWKRMLAERLVKDVERGFPSAKAPHVLDLCTGTGDIALLIARRRPGWKIVGLDFSPAMLERAGRKGSKYRCRNIQWTEGNAMEIPFPDGSFEAVTISFGLRNCADTRAVLREIARVLKPEGVLLCMDSFVPGVRAVRPFYRIYFRFVMPLLGGGREHREEYGWLEESTQQFCTPRELAQLMRRCGLGRPAIYRRMFGACVLLETTKA